MVVVMMVVMIVAAAARVMIMVMVMSFVVASACLRFGLGAHRLGPQTYDYTCIDLHKFAADACWSHPRACCAQEAIVVTARHDRLRPYPRLLAPR